jgi:hypothetical protein
MYTEYRTQSNFITFTPWNKPSFTSVTSYDFNTLPIQRANISQIELSRERCLQTLSKRTIPIHYARPTHRVTILLVRTSKDYSSIPRIGINQYYGVAQTVHTVNRAFFSPCEGVILMTHNLFEMTGFNTHAKNTSW